MPTILAACTDAERSKRFIDMQLNPKAEWKGWPTEVAEAWLNKRPKVLFDYFAGTVTAERVGRAFKSRLHDTYRPATGAAVGRPPRVPQKGLQVPTVVSEALDDATWDAMGRMGGRPDLVALRQAVKIPTDREDDTPIVLKSAGTVTGRALQARYTSIRGDLYWADIRNTLQLWIMARPELVTEYEAWAAKGSPRAWEEGGEWVEGHREHNPIVHIRTSAFRTALKAISQWRNDGNVSLDAIVDDGGWEAVKALQKPAPQRTQHKAKPGHEHYTWGLRDRVDCYHFPVEVRTGG